MSPIPAHFQLDYRPKANPASIVNFQMARFTILTSRLIRLEYDPSGKFEDRASQAFWYREQLTPKFTQIITGGALSIETDALVVQYTGGVFSAQSLSVELKHSGAVWHYGDEDSGNLGGTGRTLDGADGPIALEPGLVSRDGWSVLDDSRTLVFNEECWLVARRPAEGALDLYFFGYGQDYKGCLEEFSRITGRPPMVPRWVLGNWWSRYWEYTQDELTGLMDDFQRHDIPLSICIIDMDWHITHTGNKSSGWTGYTWNRDLFPDPVGLLKSLHQKGLRVALNLHPADGVHPHEEMYAEMTARMGVEPESKQPVEFDIANPQFVNAYFEVLHHPQEAQGMDFWWMDWQQGTHSKMEGLDPLWWLNHLHYYDLGRDGKKRPFIFSRWGGHGNQRYPIGFSGDTVVSWQSLAFQPYFTATAANVNYGWWSHDIGGHMRGVEEGELYTRWVQYGVFSPIFRVHCTKNMFQERRPWGYDAEVLRVTKDAMQLRHALIPYLYTMGWRYSQQSIPPILPMYYEYPARDEAYVCPNQYLFGSELIAAPFTNRRDEDTQLSRQVVWLPEGGGIGFEDGRKYPQGWQSVYGGLDEIPLFARPGAIVPLAEKTGWGGVENPGNLDIYIFPGADRKFELYEDDGETNAYLDGSYSLTAFEQSWNDRRQVVRLGRITGNPALIPPRREYRLHFRGGSRPTQVELILDGETKAIRWEYDQKTQTVNLDPFSLPRGGEAVVTLTTDSGYLFSGADQRKQMCEKLVAVFKLPSGIKEMLYLAIPNLLQDAQALLKFKVMLADTQMQALAETLLRAGAEHFTSSGEDWLVAWNEEDRPDVNWALSATAPVKYWWQNASPLQADGVQPGFSAFRVGRDFDANRWNFELSLSTLIHLRFGSDPQG